MFRSIVFKNTSFGSRIIPRRNFIDLLGDDFNFSPDMKKLVKDLARPIAMVGLTVWLLKPGLKFISDLHRSCMESNMHSEDLKAAKECADLEIETRKAIATINQHAHPDIIKIQFHAYVSTRFRMEYFDDISKEPTRQPRNIKQYLAELKRKIWKW